MKQRICKEVASSESFAEAGRTMPRVQVQAVLGFGGTLNPCTANRKPLPGFQAVGPRSGAK